MNIQPIKQKNIAVSSILKSTLSDSFIIYLKTLNYHWNVTGPNFYSLHKLFEEQYTELAQALDEIAERLRQIDIKAPGTTKALLQNSSIQEDESIVDAKDMLNDLIDAHNQLVTLCKIGTEAASAAGDGVSCDMFTQRIAVHEKAIWMLKSMLK